jgi:hypothetical protein
MVSLSTNNPNLNIGVEASATGYSIHLTSDGAFVNTRGANSDETARVIQRLMPGNKACGCLIRAIRQRMWVWP